MQAPVDAQPDGDPLTRVAVYHRRVHASLERVWENVLDWEHLPWLHDAAFGAIECLGAGPWGWRARVAYRAPEGATPPESLIELRVDRDADRYVVETLEGAGAGGEIWTHLAVHASDETDIRVEFQAPGVAPQSAQAVGRGLVRLYTRLWDEDERMMRERARRLAEPAPPPRGSQPLVLGPLSVIRAHLPLQVELDGRPFRVVESEGALFAHSTVCPHRLGPLSESPVEKGRVRCPWHGYAYDVATGRGCDGVRMRLAIAPIVDVDDEGLVTLRWPERGGSGASSSSR